MPKRVKLLRNEALVLSSQLSEMKRALVAVAAALHCQLRKVRPVKARLLKLGDKLGSLKRRE